MANISIDALRNKISDWLRVSDPSINYHAALKKRHPGTGSWLVNNPAFHDWKAATNSSMLIYGKPGCGKTVLSATVLDDLFQEVATQPGKVIAYFYFDFNDAGKQKLQNALRTLLLQCALQLPDGFQYLEQLYRACDSGSRQPMEEQVRSLLTTLLTQAKQNYIVLDALDESQDRDELVVFLEELATLSHQSYRVCVLATSRPERGIDETLGVLADHTIHIESAAVDQDIGSYVDSRLQNDKRFKKWPGPVKDEIAAELQKANGMFRWAFCQLESLQRCVKLSDLRKALRALPKSLDETYARIIQVIESDGHLPKAIKVLQWLCFVDRPLRLAEIIDILAIEDGETDGGFDPAERLPEPLDIMTICSSLIGCYEYNSDCQIHDLNDDHTRSLSANRIRVRLAHFSVKEYLLSDRSLLRSDFQLKLCRSVITDGCLHYLRYMSQDPVQTRTHLETYPLGVFSARNWWQHARAEMIYDSLLEPNVFGTWVKLDDIDVKPIIRDDFVTSEDFDPPFYYAVLIGGATNSHEVVRMMLKRGCNVNALGGRYGTALQAASVGGNLETVRLLIDAGASVNLSEGWHDSALKGASTMGNHDVVKLLLDAGADVDQQGKMEHNTALMAAACNGHEKIVELLIDVGADVNIDGGSGFGTALRAASYYGHQQIVKLLIQAGADVRAQRGWLDTALQGASANGHVGIAALLLDAGADVNAQGGEACTAIQQASSERRAEVVKLLLDAGADVNIQGGKYNNALQAASYCGDERTVALLIQAGADVNMQGCPSDRMPNTALVTASEFGHEPVTKLLISAGADVNIQGCMFGTALHVASCRGRVSIAKLLIESGADVNAPGGRFNSALQCAAASALSVHGPLPQHHDYEETVKLLLDAGADVNMRGGYYGTALAAALERGNMNIAQMLRDAGAEDLVASSAASTIDEGIDVNS